MPAYTRSLKRQKYVFWGALSLTAAVSVTSIYSTQRLVELAESVEQSQSVLLQLNGYVSDLKDIETGTRGSVITGKSSYLEPYEEGLRNFGATQQRLHQLAVGNAALKKRLEHLDGLARQRIGLASSMVSARMSGQTPSDMPAALDAAKVTMDEIRRRSDELIRVERKRLERYRHTVQHQTLLTNVAIVTAVALSLAAMLWLFLTRGREIVRRQKVEQDLRDLNTELEDRVQVRAAELERSKDLLNAVIENMPDTVFLKDLTDYRYVLINEAGERLFGRPRGDLLGRIDHELFPREQASLCHDEDKDVAASRRLRHVPERLLSTSQGQRLVESRKVPIFDPDGQLRFVLGIVRDVTEQKSLEKQLRQMQRIDAVGQLTGGIAHDFNNLLAILIGNIELLREKLPDNSDAIEMADEALGAASRGAELVRRLLAFARKQHLEPTALDLNKRLPDISTLLRRTLGENIQIDVVPGTGLWPALVDPTQVDDALVNLAINARDAMPNGGRLTIETSNVVLDGDYAAHHVEVTPGEYVMLAVSDTGTGMSAETIARAFEPFFTTKEEGRGTGLGLSQVYGWVKQSGGHIKLYSELGHGTTIKLYLPKAQVAADTAASAADVGGHARGGNETILVVEDNSNVRRMVVRQLTELGYAVVEAEDGRSALETVQSGAHFDLLLTDVIMPGNITGYELAQKIRALRPRVRVLFTSGYTELAARNGQEIDGPLLSKPYRKQDLDQSIRRLLDEDR